MSTGSRVDRMRREQRAREVEECYRQRREQLRRHGERVLREMVALREEEKEDYEISAEDEFGW